MAKLRTKHDALKEAYFMLLVIEAGGSFSTREWFDSMTGIEPFLDQSDREAATKAVQDHRAKSQPKGWDKADSGTNWKLVDACDNELKVGDVVIFTDGATARIEHLNPPHKPSSTGKVDVTELRNGFRRLVYPTTFQARFVQV